MFAALLLTALPQQQEPPAQEDRFTTGPPVGRALTPGVPNLDLPRTNTLLMSPGGNDIRANQVTTSAQNETSFAVNPLDPKNIVGVANDYRFGNVETGWYSSLDGGQTWRTGTFGLRPGFSFSGDPCVTFAPNGVVHVIAMQYFGPGGSAVWSYKSTDGGQTWNNTGVRVDLSPENDKPQVAADFSGGPRAGEITTAWSRFGTFNAHTWAASSGNGGNTWSAAARVSDNANNNAISPDVTYGPDSTIYVGWADRTQFRAYVDKSTNGVNWGADKLAAPYVQVPSPIPGSQFRMFDIFSISADSSGGPHHGNVYLAYHTWTGTHADLRVARSTDGGNTWANTLVNAGDTRNADQVMPGIIVDRRGNVNVSYYDRRLDPNRFLMWYWVARSSDAGLTWREYAVSDVGWNHTNDEFGGTFIGDYTDVDAYNGLVYPFWCDSRTGSQEVYTDAVNLDLIPSAQTISAATGGRIDFAIHAGPNLGGRSYLLVGSASGTEPGTTLPNGLLVPLNRDNFTDFTLANANSAFLPGSSGTLDAQGNAAAAIDSLGPINPAFIGATFYFSVVIDTANPAFASPPTGVRVLP